MSEAVDIAQKQAAAKLAAKQDRWEIVKVLAAFIGASAVMMGAILALSNYLHPNGQQQPMFPPGTVITIPPAQTK
jgi:hypothetical protein